MSQVSAFSASHRGRRGTARRASGQAISDRLPGSEAEYLFRTRSLFIAGALMALGLSLCGVMPFGPRTCTPSFRRDSCSVTDHHDAPLVPRPSPISPLSSLLIASTPTPTFSPPTPISRVEEAGQAPPNACQPVYPNPLQEAQASSCKKENPARPERLQRPLEDV